MNLINFFSAISVWFAFLVFLIFIALIVSFSLVFREALSARNEFIASAKHLALYFSLMVLCVALSKYMSHSVVNAAENAFQEKAVNVFVDGVVLSDQEKEALKVDFLSLEHFKLAGSQPEESYEVRVVSDNYDLRFDFRGDSRERNLYWLYYQGYSFSGKLGMVRTEVVTGVK